MVLASPNDKVLWPRKYNLQSVNLYCNKQHIFIIWYLMQAWLQLIYQVMTLNLLFVFIKNSPNLILHFPRPVILRSIKFNFLNLFRFYQPKYFFVNSILRNWKFWFQFSLNFKTKIHFNIFKPVSNLIVQSIL